MIPSLSTSRLDTTFQRSVYATRTNNRDSSEREPTHFFAIGCLKRIQSIPPGGARWRVGSDRELVRRAIRIAEPRLHLYSPSTGNAVAETANNVYDGNIY